MLRLKWILGVAASVILDIPTGYGEAVVDSINLTLLGLCAPSGNVTRLRKLRFFQKRMNNDSRKWLFGFSHRELKMAPAAQCQPGAEGLQGPSEKEDHYHMPKLSLDLPRDGEFIDPGDGWKVRP